MMISKMFGNLKMGSTDIQNSENTARHDINKPVTNNMMEYPLGQNVTLGLQNNIIDDAGTISSLGKEVRPQTNNTNS